MLPFMTAHARTAKIEYTCTYNTILWALKLYSYKAKAHSPSASPASMEDDVGSHRCELWNTLAAVSGLLLLTFHECLSSLQEL